MCKKKDMRKYKNEFVDLYKYGYSLREIATMYDVSKGTISRYVKEEVEIQRGLTEKQKEKAKELFECGLSVNAISIQLNATYSTVKYYLSKEFGKLTDLDRKYDHLVDDFKKMYEEGYSANEIGDKYGIHRQTILSYLREEGTYVRSYSESSRLYDLKEDYFDTLDGKKAYILGIIFAIGRLNQAPANQFIDLKIFKDKLEILNTVINAIFVGDAPCFNMVDNTYCLRVSSTKLYDTVEELGIAHKESGEIREFSERIKPYENEFWEGFFYANVNVNGRFVLISAYREHLPVLCNYLSSKGIQYKLFDNVASHIEIERNSEVIKLVKEHNTIKDKIQEKVIELESKGKKHSWGEVIRYIKG